VSRSAWRRSWRGRTRGGLKWRTSLQKKDELDLISKC
jgi:hypothetical protein